MVNSKDLRYAKGSGVGGPRLHPASPVFLGGHAPRHPDVLKLSPATSGVF